MTSDWPDADRFRRFAAASAILVAPLAYVTIGLIMVSIDFEMEVFADPARMVAIGEAGATLFRWSQLLDMFSFYLLWIPPMVFLWYWLRSHAPLTVALLTAVGVGFALIAALGAAINAAALPSLMIEYAQAGAEEQAAIVALFTALTDAVIVGLFGIFGRFLISVWLLGTGYFLRRERRYLGYAAIVFGIFTSLSFLGNVIGAPGIHSVGVTGYIFLGPLWVFWLGIVIWRGPAMADVQPQTAATPTGQPG